MWKKTVVDQFLNILPFVVDGLLVVLLVAAIVVFVVVYRRLDEVRKGQAEMSHVVDQLNKAVSDAEVSIHNLRATADSVEAGLGQHVKEAKALRDELAMITEAGNNLADRIEKGVSEGRAAPKGGGAGAPVTAEPATSKPKSGKKQQELMSALKQAR